MKKKKRTRVICEGWATVSATKYADTYVTMRGHWKRRREVVRAFPDDRIIKVKLIRC